MIVLAKSAVYLKPQQVADLIVKCCPIRLFKHVNIINDNGLMYQYKMPSKAKLDLSVTCPVDDCLFEYLVDNELRLNKLGEQQFVINSLRQMQSDGKTAIKEFTNGLSSDQVEKYAKRIATLQDCLNNDCAPHVTRTISKQWDERIRQPLFKQIKQVQL